MNHCYAHPSGVVQWAAMHPIPGQEVVSPFWEAETVGPDRESLFSSQISGHQPVCLPQEYGNVSALACPLVFHSITKHWFFYDVHSLLLLPYFHKTSAEEKVKHTLRDISGKVLMRKSTRGLFNCSKCSKNTQLSVCCRLIIRFGDVEDLRGLTIR